MPRLEAYYRALAMVLDRANRLNLPGDLWLTVRGVGDAIDRADHDNRARRERLWTWLTLVLLIPPFVAACIAGTVVLLLLFCLLRIAH
jgi:hypothetical protein